MKNFLVRFCGCALLVAACVVQAKADTFYLSFIGGQNCISGTCVGGYTGNLTITALPTATSGVDTITGVSGTTGGYTVNGLIGTTPGYAGNDNLLFTKGITWFDFNGVSYYLNESGVNVPFNVYADADSIGIYDFASGANLQAPLSQGVIANVSVTPSVASTPEPGSLVLLGTGALGLVGAVRRRFQK